MAKEQSVKVSKNKDHKDGVRLRTLLKSTLMLITKAKREEHKESILELCELLEFKGVEEFITQDARALRWADRSEEEVAEIRQRQAEKAVKYHRELSEAKKNYRLKEKSEARDYHVEWRGEADAYCSIDQAAKHSGVSVNALRIRISKGKGTAHFKGIDTPIIVRKIKNLKPKD